MQHLATHHLSIRRAGRWVLKDVHLTLQAGEWVTLIGQNGSGKTTLIRALLGLTPLDAGQVDKMPGLRIGYMPQRLSLNDCLPLTVQGFLKLAPVYDTQYFDTLGISKLLSHQLRLLSGGEMQRVLFARALMNRPNCLILDEPLQGVDVQGQAEFYRLLIKIKAELDCSVLMVSHDLHVVMAKTDKVICLNQHICCEGTPEAVQKHPAFLNLFGEANVPLALYTHTHDHQHSVSCDERDCP